MDPVNEAQANAFLGERFGGDAGAVVPIGEGEWSKAYRFERGAAPYVVRFSAVDEDFAKDHLAMRYASRDLPIPRVVELGEAYDGFYAISERAPGGYLDALDAHQLRAVLPSLFTALDAARRVDLSDTVGYGGWNAQRIAPHATWRAALLDIGHDRPTDRVRGWRERLVASPTGAEPFDTASALLHDLVDACPEDRHLIHSDLLHFNVLVTGDRLSAVLDWGCGMYGDFLYDIAWLDFYQPWFPAWHAIDFRREAAAHYASIGLRVPDLEARLRCYEVHIGLGDLIWNAYKGNWEALETAARRTSEVALR
ncbi:MAG: phosphotransferase [Chloroflexota bacterium]|nr:phosphotransferase [Chloroflexota bacterium]